MLYCHCGIINFIIILLIFLVGGLDGTRPVLVPSDTVSRFKTVASANTRRNIETCGILAGKLVRYIYCTYFDGQECVFLMGKPIYFWFGLFSAFFAI